MTDARLEREAPGAWRLTGELTYETVPALAERVGELFADAEAVQVELGGVTRSDSAGVALLVEWVSEARRRGVPIRYLDIPSQMLAIARVSSLDHVLPLGRG